MSNDIGRNDPCHCKSGKKYKKCCLDKDQAKSHAEIEKNWKAAQAAAAKAAASEEAKPAAHQPSKFIPSSNSPSPHQNRSGVTPKMNIPRRTGGG